MRPRAADAPDELSTKHLLCLQKAFEEDASTDEAGNEADDEHETESDGALGDEQDEEVDSAYLDRLAKEAAKIKVRQCRHPQAGWVNQHPAIWALHPHSMESLLKTDRQRHIWSIRHACCWSSEQRSAPGGSILRHKH